MKWIDDDMPYFTLTVARRTTATYCSARPRKKSSETIEECHLLMSAAPEAAAQSQVTQPEKCVLKMRGVLFCVMNLEEKVFASRLIGTKAERRQSLTQYST